MPDTSDSPEQ